VAENLENFSFPLERLHFIEFHSPIRAPRRLVENLSG
jgi:hypothetical protein